MTNEKMIKFPDGYEMSEKEHKICLVQRVVGKDEINRNGVVYKLNTYHYEAYGRVKKPIPVED